MTNFLKKIFDFLLGPEPSSRVIPPRPADWRTTLKDLYAEMNAGKRTSLGQPELKWAEEYELSLIPEGYRFPRHGDVYESLEDQTVEYITVWSAPYSGGGEGKIFTGERVRIEMHPAEKQLAVMGVPEDYRKLEERMVSAKERENGKYGGFQICLETMTLNEKFKLVK